MNDKDDKVFQAVEPRGKRIGLRQIAKALGVGKSTV